MSKLPHILKSASAWGMISLVVRLSSIAILLPLTTRLISASELGYWYLFSNLYAAIVVLDFGVTSASSRSLAIRLADLRAAVEKPPLRARLATLLGTCATIYKWLGIITVFVLSLGGGWWIWQQTMHYAGAQGIREAWLLACPAFALAVMANFGRSLLSAENRVNVLQFLSTCAFALQFAVGITCLLNGWGMRALVMANLALFAVLALSFVIAIRRPGDLAEAGPWRRGSHREVLGLLKISAGTFSNNFSSYLVLSSSVLVASHFFPIREVATYGLSLQILLIAAQASGVWIEVKGPLFAHWHLSNPETLRRVFIQRMRLAILSFTACVAGAAVVGPRLLAMIGSQTPILGLEFFLALATMVFVVMHAAQFDALCMALGHNPFVKPYLGSALAGILLMLILIPAYGLWALIACPLFVQLAWNAWWVPMQGLRLLGLTPAQYCTSFVTGHHLSPKQE